MTIVTFGPSTFGLTFGQNVHLKSKAGLMKPFALPSPLKAISQGGKFAKTHYVFANKYEVFYLPCKNPKVFLFWPLIGISKWVHKTGKGLTLLFGQQSIFPKMAIICKKAKGSTLTLDRKLVFQKSVYFCKKG